MSEKTTQASTGAGEKTAEAKIEFIAVWRTGLWPTEDRGTAEAYARKNGYDVVALVPLPLLDALLAVDEKRLAVIAANEGIAGWGETVQSAVAALRALHAAVERGE